MSFGWSVLRSRGAIAVAVGALTVGAVGITLTRPNPGNASSHAPGHDHGDLGGFHQYTEPGESWPPRIAGISQDRPHPTTPGRSPRATVATDLVGGARNPQQRRLADALGERFELIASGPEVSAKGVRSSDRVHTVYFSYSKNQTVEVVERRGRIVRLVSQDAAQNQPPRTEDEEARAAELARATFRARGIDRVDELDAYVILGLPHPDNEMPAETTPFFSQRVLYVSFHVDALSDPEYVAWVDLTDERVLRAEEE